MSAELRDRPCGRRWGANDECEAQKLLRDRPSGRYGDMLVQAGFVIKRGGGVREKPPPPQINTLVSPFAWIVERKKMVSKGGTIEYKCRRCGEIYARASAPDVARALQCALYDFMEQPPEWGAMQIRQTDVHQCKPTCWGVADLVGGREQS